MCFLLKSSQIGCPITFVPLLRPLAYIASHYSDSYISQFGETVDDFSPLKSPTAPSGTVKDRKQDGSSHFDFSMSTTKVCGGIFRNRTKFLWKYNSNSLYCFGDFKTTPRLFVWQPMAVEGAESPLKDTVT